MRNLTEAVLAQLTGPVRPAYFARIEFLSGPCYLWTGLTKKTWDGHDWIGLGNLAGISGIGQNSEVAAENITLSLSGVPSNLVTAAINECRINYRVEVWFAFLDDEQRVIEDPVKFFDGKMDVPTIEDGAETCTISITAENPLIDLQRASNRRYTTEDQEIEFPGDHGFDGVIAVQNFTGVWGKK